MRGLRVDVVDEAQLVQSVNCGKRGSRKVGLSSRAYYTSSSGPVPREVCDSQKGNHDAGFVLHSKRRVRQNMERSRRRFDLNDRMPLRLLHHHLTERILIGTGC
jgi:hypothetical protein